MHVTSEIAECLGLWLAEGDRKTKRELTLTNNCVEIILLFSSRIMKLYKGNNEPRIYAYLPAKESAPFPFEGIKVNFYSDPRANKPYYIFRLGDTAFLREWKTIANEMECNESLYSDILRGFFAGEGNIKETAKNRIIRIAQKQPLKVIDNILIHYKINFTFSVREKTYLISGRKNWDKLAELGMAELHPDKKEKFWTVYNKFKEYHHPKNLIRNSILESLCRPKTSRELANEFERTQARLQEVLCGLKKDKKVKNFHVRSKSYWVRYDSNMIIISERKKSILNLLENPLRIMDIAKSLGVEWKSVMRRMQELQTLGLVERDGYLWRKIYTDKEVLVL